MKIFELLLDELKEILIARPHDPAIEECILLTANAVKNGHTLFLCGNGGSASTVSHIANDLSCHMRNWSRKGYPVISLNESPSVLTSLTNDYGFASVFSKPLEALASPGDILWGFSTSGNSQNVIAAVSAAERIGMKTVGFSGSHGGALKDQADIMIQVRSDDVVQVENLHLIYAHAIAVSVEAMVSPMEA